MLNKLKVSTKKIKRKMRESSNSYESSEEKKITQYNLDVKDTIKKIKRQESFVRNRRDEEPG